MFRTSVIPAAIYGAEHQPWQKDDLRKLQKWALQSAGMDAPAVPLQFAACFLQPKADPVCKVLAAPLLRWHREIWNAQQEGTEALHSGKLYKIWCKAVALQSADKRSRVWVGLVAALLDSVKAFGYSWVAPHKCCSSLHTDYDIDLTMGSPKMLEDLLQRKWGT